MFENPWFKSWSLHTCVRVPLRAGAGTIVVSVTTIHYFIYNRVPVLFQ